MGDILSWFLRTVLMIAAMFFGVIPLVATLAGVGAAFGVVPWSFASLAILGPATLACLIACMVFEISPARAMQIMWTGFLFLIFALGMLAAVLAAVGGALWMLVRLCT